MFPSYLNTSTLNNKCLYKINRLLLQQKNPNREKTRDILWQAIAILKSDTGMADDSK